MRKALGTVAVAWLAAAGLVAIAPAAPASAAPVGCTADTYLVLGTGSPLTTPNVLTRRAPDGTLTSISTPGLNPWTIGLNPVDGNLYAFAYPTSDRLFRVEADGTPTDLGPIAGAPAGLISLGGFDDDGTFWIAGPGFLYAVDIATMTATPVPLSQNVQGDLAFIDGAIYATTAPPLGGQPDLARIDPATGNVTVIDLPGMISAPSIWTVDGHLYISQNTDLVEVVGYDTATPSLVTVGTGSTGFTGIARDAATCPTGPSPFLNAADDDYTASPLTPEGGIAGNVFLNDTELGAAVDAAAVTVTVTDDGGLAGVTIGADGRITVPSGTRPGTYAVSYELCSTTTIGLCDSAIVTLVVVAPGAALPATGLQSSAPLVGFAATLLLAGAALTGFRRRARG